MNERIKNLVKQTARELVYEHDDDIGGVMDVWKFQDKDIEKFAQLIVRDCISQIAMIGVSNYNDNDVGWTVDKSIENIRKHFGIKE